jgi:predicted 3-demethylubiquinone-9 3-methyltransferase (glyoxalase superfamily)
MQQITPFLWFDGCAEQARDFYLSIFKNSKVLKTSRYGDLGPGPKGTVMTTSFELNGQEFVALNGGPEFKFTPALSLVVNCDTQAEIDYYWEKLLQGGTASHCGWLFDKFGVSWQVVPRALGEMLADKDERRANRVVRALMEMIKLDLAVLKRAYDQPT